jgi:hypothetical protein
LLADSPAPDAQLAEQQGAIEVGDRWLMLSNDQSHLLLSDDHFDEHC